MFFFCVLRYRENVYIYFLRILLPEEFMPKLLFHCICLIFFANGSLAQEPAAGTDFIKEAHDRAVQSYYDFTGKQARLFNGIDHTGYYNTILGTAYYVNDSLVKGNIVYDGLLYQQVPMTYDMYQDEVVIVHFNGLKISLLSEKVKEFTFRGHRFVRHLYDSLAQVTLPTGFYDYLYEGKISVLVKRVKRLEERVTDVVTKEFLSDNKYYIFNNGAYHSFRNLRGLLAALPDKSREIRRYLKRNKMRFKADPENTILTAAKYYDSLK